MNMDDDIGTREIDTITLELKRDAARELRRLLGYYIAANDNPINGESAPVIQTYRAVDQQIAKRMEGG